MGAQSSIFLVIQITFILVQVRIEPVHVNHGVREVLLVLPMSLQTLVLFGLLHTWFDCFELLEAVLPVVWKGISAGAPRIGLPHTSLSSWSGAFGIALVFLL
jgi:hypothetical protein